MKNSYLGNVIRATMLLAIFAANPASAEIKTLYYRVTYDWAAGTSGYATGTVSQVVASDVVTLSTNDSLKVLSAIDQYQPEFNYLVIAMSDGRRMEKVAYASEAFTVAGPATVSLYSHKSGDINRPRQAGDKIAASSSYFGFEQLSLVTVEITRGNGGAADLLVPHSAIVIPADEGGPVTIVLESSVDMVNWTIAQPGQYGTTTQKRFFRVRGLRQ